MKSSVTPLGILLFALLIASCGNSVEWNSYGTVEGKKFIPAHDSSALISAGKVLIPIITKHPDDWQLQLKVCEKEDVFSASKPKVCEDRWVSVSKADYDNVRDGQQMDLPPLTEGTSTPEGKRTPEN